MVGEKKGAPEWTFGLSSAVLSGLPSVGKVGRVSSSKVFQGSQDRPRNSCVLARGGKEGGGIGLFSGSLTMYLFVSVCCILHAVCWSDHGSRLCQILDAVCLANPGRSLFVGCRMQFALQIVEAVCVCRILNAVCVGSSMQFMLLIPYAACIES